MGLKEEMEASKTSFYKMEGNELVFQLKNEESKEEFKIFDTKATDPNMKWYLEGMDITTEETNETIKVEEAKFIKSNIFQQYFPGKRKVSQVIRSVIINGQEQKFGFKITANKKLEDVLTTLKATGQNVLGYVFKMTRKGEGLKTEYNIEILGKADASQQNLEGVSITTNTTPTPIVNTPNKAEQKLIDAMKSLKPEQKTIENMKKVVSDNNMGLTDERITELFKQV